MHVFSQNLSFDRFASSFKNPSMKWESEWAEDWMAMELLLAASHFRNFTLISTFNLYVCVYVQYKIHVFFLHRFYLMYAKALSHPHTYPYTKLEFKLESVKYIGFAFDPQSEISSFSVSFSINSKSFAHKCIDSACILSHWIWNNMTFIYDWLLSTYLFECISGRVPAVLSTVYFWIKKFDWFIWYHTAWVHWYHIPEWMANSYWIASLMKIWLFRLKCDTRLSFPIKFIPVSFNAILDMRFNSQKLRF